MRSKAPYRLEEKACWIVQKSQRFMWSLYDGLKYRCMQDVVRTHEVGGGTKGRLRMSSADYADYADFFAKRKTNPTAGESANLRNLWMPFEFCKSAVGGIQSAFGAEAATEEVGHFDEKGAVVAPKSRFQLT